MASRDIKVGIFVVVSLIVIGIVVFLIGDERKMFSEHEELKAAFKDVNGLSRGSPVRMGGVDIGTVDQLGYGSDPKDATIFVKMSIVSKEARRIRADSFAEVQGKGLLGDKMIVITVGSTEEPRLAPGELVPTRESKDLESIISDMKKVASGADKVVENLEKTTAALADDQFHKDIKDAVSHLSQITGSMENGDGYVGRLLNDQQEAERLSATVQELKESAGELKQLLRSARMVVDQVRTGPGLVHEVIYQESGSKALSQVGGAAEEVGLALKGIREGESFAHGVLYEKDSGEMIDNLNQASADLQAIVSDVRAGKGTLGAFLVDPSVYEDVKVLLGNVGRNRSLRALVRYSIQQDEKAGRVVDPGTSESSPGTVGGGVAASAGGGSVDSPASAP